MDVQPTDAELASIIKWAGQIAWMFRNHNWGPVDVDDLQQEGILAALIAYPRWDRSHSLATFLVPRIRGGIRDYLRQTDHLDRGHRRRIKKGLESEVFNVELEDAHHVHAPDPIDAVVEHLGDQQAVEAALLGAGRRRPAHYALLVDWVADDGLTPQIAIGARHGYGESRTSQIVKAFLEDAGG